MTIRIVTDSTCDMPAEIIQKYKITVIPCYINFEDKSYLDVVELSRHEFYTRVAKLDTFPTTSAPGVGFFARHYQQAIEQGADEIISIHIGGGLSNLSNVARLAAEEFRQVKVTVLSIGQVALAAGFLIAAAARALADGQPVDSVRALLGEMDKRTHTFAALDTLEFLQHSGRVPHTLVKLAGLLSIKPVITLYQGSIGLADRIRTSSQQIDVLIKHAMRHSPLEQVGVVHAHAAEKARECVEVIKDRLKFSGQLWVEEATPILGVHVGPGTLGLAFVQSK